MENNKILDEISILPLLKASETFEKVMDMDFNEEIRDSAIKRFEYSFELVWKILKKILTIKGIEVNNPRDTFRESAINGFVEDPEKWFYFLKMRNLTSHCYNEELSQEVYLTLPKFRIELRKVIERIKKL